MISFENLTKTQKISASIMTLMAQGMSVREAMDAYFGEGTYDMFAEDLYHSLRRKAGIEEGA